MDDGVPQWYTPYRAVHESAALFPRPDNGLIEVVGSEREEYLDNLCTNRVAGLMPGETTRALMLNPTKGRVLADFLVAATEDALWLDCEGGCASTVEALLQRYYFGQDVEFRNHGDEWSIVSLQGPLSGEILTRSGATLPTDHVGAHIETVIGSTAVRVVRWTDTGEVGFRVWAPTSGEQAVKAALIDGGASVGDDEAWTVLQIEAGRGVIRARKLSRDCGLVADRPSSCVGCDWIPIDRRLRARFSMATTSQAWRGSPRLGSAPSWARSHSRSSTGNTVKPVRS
jgi:glycine cleavage system aminomethyltransferase T